MTDIPLFGPGTVLIFGIVMAPIYLMLLGWSVGEPIDRPRWLLGLSYVVGVTVALWGGLYLLTVLIGVVFF
jgi:hypothetical protein